MKFDLTEPSAEQISEVAAIWAAGWQEAHADIVPAALTALRTPGSFLKRAQNAAGQTRIALSEGTVLGFVMVQADELYQMYVAPEGRGTGVAQALMADAEQRIAAAGATTAWLACAVGNDRAVRFYEKCGWVNAGLKEVELDTPGDPFRLTVIRFEKTLSAP